MTFSTRSGVPQISSPFVELGTGNINQPWFQFLITLWNRTGGGGGTGGNYVAIIPSGSPYTYVAPRDGYLYFDGGVYVRVAITRSGVTLTTTIVRGYIPVTMQDMAVLTYATTPTVYFVG